MNCLSVDSSKMPTGVIQRVVKLVEFMSHYLLSLVHDIMGNIFLSIKFSSLKQSEMFGNKAKLNIFSNL